MRVAIYVRVSTDMQVEEGYSLDAQIDRCKAYAVSQGWDIFNIYIEEGQSAKDLDRMEVKRMLSDAEQGLFDVLLVYRLDRLTRSVRDLHNLLDTFERYNIKFRSATEVYDTTTAMGKLFITIVAALAEWERQNLGERVRFGMEELVRKGKWHGGAIPYGYDWDGTTMHIVPQEAAILRKLRQLYMSGLGFRAVSIQLNALKYLRRDGVKWTSNNVHYALENPIYAGKYAYGKKNKQGNYVQFKKSERVDLLWADTGFPAIFTWEEYEEHMKRIKRRQTHGTSRKREYWFGGVLRCARCGGSMTGRAHNKPNLKNDPKHFHYLCATRKTNKGCNLPMLKQELIEEMLLEYISQINLTADEIAAAGDNLSAQSLNIDSEKEALQKELKVIVERRKKWQYMFAEDLMSESDFRARKREEDEKEQIIQSQLDNLKATEIGMNEDYIMLLTDLPELWDRLDDGERKEMIQTIFASVYVDCDVETGTGMGSPGSTLPFRITEINFN